MKLGGNKIQEAFSSCKWKIYGGEPRIGPNSIDVTLNKNILYQIHDVEIDIFNPKDYYIKSQIPVSGLIIHPQEFFLGCTNERVKCDEPLDGRYFAPMYEGRSTLGRLGIGSHITAGFGDYDFQGCFTLEIVNHSANPVRLYPNIRIGQIYFDEVLDPRIYVGSYNHYTEPIAPVLGKDRF